MNITHSLARASAICLLILLVAGLSPVAAWGHPDSATVAASTRYRHSRVFTFIFGKNYRRDWQTPVTMQRLNITSQRLSLVSLKGGFESISMNMATADSTQMVLRTIDKSLDKLLRPWMKRTPLRAITQDIISASQPYAAFTVPVFCDALGITHTNPVLYYVDDTAFGKYHQWFDGRVCLLEERIPVRPGTKHEEMDAPFTLQQKDNHVIILQRELLRARLLDMILGDWDRHPGQWNWGSYDSAGLEYIYPVPVDRDMVYFNSTGGFLAYIRLYSVHYMRGFKTRIRKLYQLNYKARDFDRELLNQLDRSDWEITVREVQRKLTDAVIDEAVDRIPKEVRAFRGDEIKRKLRSRRDDLYPAAMKYYDRLSRQVYIVASDKPDLITLTSTPAGTEVAVYNLGTPSPASRIYHRTLTGHTKRLYLTGFSADDKTELSPHRHPRIKAVSADSKHNIRHRNIKLLGKSVNHLGQPGVKG